MLDALAGIAAPAERGITLQAGPVGFVIACSQRDAETLLDAAQPVRVRTDIEVDPPAITIVGFSDAQRRELYRALRRVGGIGRASALAILGACHVIDVLRAAAGADHAFFAAQPGIGAKRAQTIASQLAKAYGRALPTPLPVPTLAFIEARDALLLTGLDEGQAEERLQDAAAGGARSAEQLLKAAA
jgi:Holliday junction resolvasome RuvABC DNA-binding subunit